MSACHSFAWSMICDFGSPSTNSVDTLKFAARSFSAAFKTIAFACSRRAFQTVSNSGSGPDISRPISKAGGSTTFKTFTSVFGGHGLAITLFNAAWEKSEPSIAIRIFIGLLSLRVNCLDHARQLGEFSLTPIRRLRAALRQTMLCGLRSDRFALYAFVSLASEGVCDSCHSQEQLTAHTLDLPTKDYEIKGTANSGCESGAGYDGSAEFAGKRN